MTDHEIHLLDHKLSRPSSACTECRERHETAVNSRSSRYYCAGSGHIVYTLEIKSRSPFWVATTTCLVCNRKVRATRPTQGTPWSLVGTHKEAN